MFDSSRPDELREKIRAIGVARVAREAGLRPTTLYSFCAGDTINLRSDTQAKVIAALSALSDTSPSDAQLYELLDAWPKLTDDQRRAVLDTIRAFLRSSEA